MQDNKAHSMSGIFGAETIRRKSRTAGFTIVELLIVIVVIGILAAITITAFNGAQVRSRNALTITATKEYIKAINLYAIDNGAYPAQIGACLGTGYEYQGIVGRCGGETASLNENATFNSALEKYLPQRPQLSTKNLTIATGKIRAGAYYDFISSGSARIYYILEGRGVIVKTCG